MSKDDQPSQDGVDNDEAARLKQERGAAIEAAVSRMKDLGVRRFFTETEWRTLATYDGPVVSGDPAGVTKKDKPA